jgi:hypothetical protein
MSMSADTRTALVEAPIGLSKEELFAQTGAPDERKYYALLSSLKGSGKIKVGGERGGNPYYLIDNWPESSLQGQGSSIEEPKQLRISAKEFAAQGGDAAPAKSPAKRMSNVIQPKDGPSPPDGGAQFAISEDGVLGIEKDDGKIKLDRGEFERLRTFIDRSEEVWKVRPA